MLSDGVFMSVSEGKLSFHLHLSELQQVSQQPAPSSENETISDADKSPSAWGSLTSCRQQRTAPVSGEGAARAGITELGCVLKALQKPGVWHSTNGWWFLLYKREILIAFRRFQSLLSKWAVTSVGELIRWVCQDFQYMNYGNNTIGSSRVPNLPWVRYGTYFLILSVLFWLIFMNKKHHLYE